jgi:hypothetical protein
MLSDVQSIPPLRAIKHNRSSLSGLHSQPEAVRRKTAQKMGMSFFAACHFLLFELQIKVPGAEQRKHIFVQHFSLPWSSWVGFGNDDEEQHVGNPLVFSRNPLNAHARQGFLRQALRQAQDRLQDRQSDPGSARRKSFRKQ